MMEKNIQNRVSPISDGININQVVSIKLATGTKYSKLSGIGTCLSFHRFSFDQLIHVNINHKSENIQFRKLRSRKISTGVQLTSSYDYDQNTGYHLSGVSGNHINIRRIYQKIILMIENFLNSYHNYQLGCQLKLSKGEKLYVGYQAGAKIVNIPPLESITVEGFLDLVTSSKESSLKVQGIIESASDSIIEYIVDLVIPNLDYLVFHKLGIYPLNSLIERSPIFENHVGKYALEIFNYLIVTEHGSKLLQKLAFNSNSFMQKSIKIFCKNWSFLSENISSVFYLGFVMKISSDKKDFSDIKYCIENQIDLNMPLRYNKRILVSFVRYCRIEDIEFVFRLLRKRYLLQEILNDIYFALCLSIILSRNYQPLENWLLEQDNSKLCKLLKIKHFRSLSETIVSDGTVDFKTKFLSMIKTFLKEFLTRESISQGVSSIIYFALWLVIKHLDLKILLQDTEMCRTLVFLYEVKILGKQ